jgi:hypothetical protein
VSVHYRISEGSMLFKETVGLRSQSIRHIILYFYHAFILFYFAWRGGDHMWSKRVALLK